MTVDIMLASGCGHLIVASLVAMFLKYYDYKEAKHTVSVLS